MSNIECGRDSHLPHCSQSRISTALADVCIRSPDCLTLLAANTSFVMRVLVGLCDLQPWYHVKVVCSRNLFVSGRFFCFRSCQLRSRWFMRVPPERCRLHPISFARTARCSCFIFGNDFQRSTHRFFGSILATQPFSTEIFGGPPQSAPWATFFAASITAANLYISLIARIKRSLERCKLDSKTAAGCGPMWTVVFYLPRLAFLTNVFKQLLKKIDKTLHHGEVTWVPAAIAPHISSSDVRNIFAKSVACTHGMCGVCICNGSYMACMACVRSVRVFVACLWRGVARFACMLAHVRVLFVYRCAHTLMHAHVHAGTTRITTARWITRNSNLR